MDCSRCGTPASPGDRVCRVCGAPLAQAAPAAPPAETAPMAQAAPSLPSPEPAPTVSGTPLSAAGAQPAPATAQPNALPQAALGYSPTNPSAPASPYASPYASYGAYPYAAYGASASYPAQPTQPAQPAQSGYPYPYPSYYGYYYPYAYAYAPPAPPRPKGETYRQVLGWIVTIGSALSVVIGLLLVLGTVVLGARGAGGGLNVIAGAAGIAIAGVAGGVVGIYFGITAIMRRPSVRFSLPSVWLLLGLTVLAIGAGVVIWHAEPTPGDTFVALPLVLLAGVLPALTILAYGGRLLGFPSTWRHMALSLIHGATLAIALASLLELLGGFLIALIFQAFGLDGSFALGDLNTSPNNPAQAIILLLILSVVAPVVEEGVKPLGAILVMTRLRSAGEAFFLGLAAGVGFDMVETVGYFGMGQADWVAIAIERIGAGLLHGLGAGMAALGWYYLLRGKGVSHRWLRGFGGIAYAVLQHAIFNGSNLLGLLPGPIGNFMNLPLYLYRLPLGRGVGLFFGLYLIILGVLTVVALRLGRAERSSPPATAEPSGASGGGQPAPTPMPEPVAGGAR